LSNTVTPKLCHCNFMTLRNVELLLDKYDNDDDDEDDDDGNLIVLMYPGDEK